jgi:hypothetical protein
VNNNLIDCVPAPLPPITLPPGWFGGQAPIPAGNGIFVANACYSTSAGQTLNVAAQYGLLSFALDFDGNSLQVSAVNGSAANVGSALTLASGSTLTVNADGSLTYAPAGGFQGDDTFTFTVSDGTNTTTATADINVTGPQITLPNASYSTTAGQTLTVDAANGLLSGAIDPSGNSLQVTGISAAGNLPSSYYWDSIQPVGGAYLNAISFGGINPGALMPVTPGGGETGAIGAPFTLPSGSTVTVNADGSITYVPAAGFTGDDTFFFTVSDGTLSATAECAISVTGPQLKVPDADYTATAGVALNENATNGLLSGVYDSSGAAVTVIAINGTSLANGTATVTLASGSTLTVNADGSFVYTAAAGFQGDDTFTFTVGDGFTTTTGTATINVVRPQMYILIPTYTTQPAQTLTVKADSSLLLDGSDSANNPVSDGLVSATGNATVTAVNGVAANVGTPITLSSGATLTVNADGTFTYVPAPGYQGQDSFQFTLSDGTASATGTANINVGQPQLQAEDQLFMTYGQATATFSAADGLLADVVDSSGSTVQVRAINGSAANIGVPVTLPTGATVTVNADGSFTYVSPATDLLSSPYAGPNSFTFTVSDGTQSVTETAAMGTEPIGVTEPIVWQPVTLSPTPIYVTTTAPTVTGTPFPTVNNYTLAVGGQSQAVTVAPNATVTLTASTSGSQTGPIQWQVSANNGKTWSNVQEGSGVQSVSGSELTITADSSTNNKQYRAQIGAAGKTAQTTNSFALTVATPPKVAVTASTLKPEAGQTVILTATVKGTVPTQVEWQSESPGGAWTDISGATSLTYSFTADSTDNGNRYRVVVSNAAGTADRTPVTLTVTTPPAVTEQPSSQTVAVGAKTTFTAGATGTPTPAIQWQYSTNDGKTWTNLQNGAGIQGVHAGTLTITTTSRQNGILVRAVFSSSQAGKSVSAVTSTASLTVVTPLPVVTVQPSSQTAKVNAQAAFAASATGAASIQWQVSTDDGQTWINVRGATSKSLRVKATHANDGAAYRAVFTDAGGSTTTDAVTLSVVS